MSGKYPDIPPPSYEDVIKGNYGTEALVYGGEILASSAQGSNARVPMFSRQITDSRTLEMRGSLPVQQFLLSRGSENAQNPVCDVTNAQPEEGPRYGGLNVNCC